MKKRGGYGKQKKERKGHSFFFFRDYVAPVLFLISVFFGGLRTLQKKKQKLKKERALPFFLRTRSAEKKTEQKKQNKKGTCVLRSDVVPLLC